MGSSPFLNEVRASIRLRGMSLRTEKTYIYWIRNFIRYHNYRHPREMGPDEVIKYLGYLAAKRQVAINTQKVALNALTLDSRLRGYDIKNAENDTRSIEKDIEHIR